ncbi:sugar porter family MFS transporter [candidate division KSB1 bacterium]
MPDINQSRDGNVRMGYVVSVCLTAALGGLLFGYDTAVISGAIGFLKGHFTLDPNWTGWAASSALIGCIVGVAAAGVLSDRLGRKRVLQYAALLFLVSAVGTALPRTFSAFVIFRMIGGVGVGAASMTSPMYIAEITPARIRGRMVSVNQLAIVFGMLVVYFVNYFIAGLGTETWNTEVGWRWMFASEALPATLFLLFLIRVPESPRWLVKQDRAGEAGDILARVGGAAYADAELGSIRETIARESGSIRQLFQPGMRIVLSIGVVLAVLQQITGINVFMYYAPEIFKKLGSETNSALLQTVVVGAVNLTFTVIAIRTVDLIGRKPLLMIGAAGMGLCLTALGLAAFFQRAEIWVLVFILGYIACFALGMGPVVWVVLSEIFPTRIRGRAMAMATVMLWAANFVVSQTFPMMNENEWLVQSFHHGFPFWIYAAMCLVMVVFVGLYVPETKRKSLEEIEKMWPGQVTGGDR